MERCGGQWGWTRKKKWRYHEWKTRKKLVGLGSILRLTTKDTCPMSHVSYLALLFIHINTKWTFFCLCFVDCCISQVQWGVVIHIWTQPHISHNSIYDSAEKIGVSQYVCIYIYIWSVPFHILVSKVEWTQWCGWGGCGGLWGIAIDLSLGGRGSYKAYGLEVDPTKTSFFLFLFLMESQPCFHTCTALSCNHLLLQQCSNHHHLLLLFPLSLDFVNGN